MLPHLQGSLSLVIFQGKLIALRTNRCKVWFISCRPLFPVNISLLYLIDLLSLISKLRKFVIKATFRHFSYGADSWVVLMHWGKYALLLMLKISIGTFTWLFVACLEPLIRLQNWYSTLAILLNACDPLHFDWVTYVLLCFAELGKFFVVNIFIGLRMLSGYLVIDSLQR